MDKKTWALPFDVCSEIELTSDFAAVEVLPVPVGVEPHVAAYGHKDRSFTVDVQAKGKRARVIVSGAQEAFGALWGEPGWLVVKVFVPRSVKGRIGSAAGRIHVHDLSGCDLTVSTEAGSILAEDLDGRLCLVSNAGKIDGTRLAGTFDVSSSAGAVRLGIEHLDEGNHTIRANVGAVQVDLAEGHAVRITAKATMGACRVDYPSRRDAATRLDLHANVGAIRVREVPAGAPRKPARDPAPLAPDEGPYRRAASVADPAATVALVTPPPEEDPDDGALERIVALVAAGKISAEEASQLLLELES